MSTSLPPHPPHALPHPDAGEGRGEEGKRATWNGWGGSGARVLRGPDVLHIPDVRASDLRGSLTSPLCATPPWWSVLRRPRAFGVRVRPSYLWPGATSGPTSLLLKPASFPSAPPALVDPQTFLLPTSSLSSPPSVHCLPAETGPGPVEVGRRGRGRGRGRRYWRGRRRKAEGLVFGVGARAPGLGPRVPPSLPPAPPPRTGPEDCGGGRRAAAGLREGREPSRLGHVPRRALPLALGPMRGSERGSLAPLGAPGLSQSSRIRIPTGFSLLALGDQDRRPGGPQTTRVPGKTWSTVPGQYESLPLPFPAPP